MDSVNNKPIIHDEPSPNVIDLTGLKDTPPSSPPWDTAPNSEDTGSYMCPVCLGPAIEPTRTICGHVYCQECIKASIRTFRKCPVCKKRATMGRLQRIFL